MTDRDDGERETLTGEGQAVADPRRRPLIAVLDRDSWRRAPKGKLAARCPDLPLLFPGGARLSPSIFWRLEQVEQEFRFDPREPRSGRCYLLHPVEDDYYIRAVEYSVRVFETKVRAFERIVAILGARRLVLEQVTRVAADGGDGAAAGSDGGFVERALHLMGAGSSERPGYAQRQVLREYGRPAGRPRYPEEYDAWVQHYPALETLAENRIERELLQTSYRLIAHQREEIGRDEHLSRLLTLPGEIGDRFRAGAQTAFHLGVEFWPFT